MYWTNYTTDRIHRANLDGSNVENLVTTGLGEPYGIALGPSASSQTVREDVNLDGVVDARDLAYIALRYGRTGESDADINDDGVVNIDDLILVAAAIDNASAKPSVRFQSQIPKGLTAEQVQQWLTEAKLTQKQTATYQRGKLVLEHLLKLLTPKETALRANYPNPFNPDTYIPYQLATPANVTITIYAINGQIVRTLALGHQAAGVYTGKSRAAYWDGRDQFGAQVASGIYFYTFTADDFAAVGKMSIVK